MTSKNASGSVSSSDLIDAKLEEHQMCGSKQCPSCGHKLERKPDWFGLPAGVKFDPTDQELIEHLEAKVESEQSKSHPLIDEFIPTIEGEDGICYTHPEKLPGVTKDGLSRHFFHRPSKAYTTGTRKRRKIQTECDLQRGETRWHKTGKTRPVMVNGKQKGCKKILVLYTNFGKHRKPEKTNWVMHQYHLGQLEEEKEGELVVSKIFYQTQPRQCSFSEKGTVGEVSVDHRRDGSGSGSIGGGSSSSREINQQEDLHGAAMVRISSYTSLDIQQQQQPKSDNFSFAPFRKSFDEVGMMEVPKGRDASGRTCMEQDQQHQTPGHHMGQDCHHHQAQAHQPSSSSAPYISRLSKPISAIISPPLHQTTTSSIFLDDAAYQDPRMILQTDKFQNHHHQKLSERSSTGLEELIMGCTSSADLKEESTVNNPQEQGWLRYSYWADPDNPDHHG